MLRTSLRRELPAVTSLSSRFLSSNAQDFIEETSRPTSAHTASYTFLSSNAQDFIEDGSRTGRPYLAMDS